MLALAVALAMSQGHFVPKLWSDLPARIKFLIEELKEGEILTDAVGGPPQECVKARMELAVIGKPALGPVLSAAKLLNRNQATNAVIVLGKMRDSAAVPTLLSIIQEENSPASHSWAYDSIGQLKDRSAVPLLLKELQNSDPRTRLDAATALFSINEASTIPALCALLRDEGSYDVESIPLLSTDPTTDLKGNTVIGDEVVGGFSHFGETAAPELRKYLKEGGLVGLRAAIALAYIGDPSCEDKVLPLADGKLPTGEKGGPSDSLAYSAKSAIRHLKDPALIERARALLRKDPEEFEAIEYLSNFSLKDAGPEFANYYRAGHYFGIFRQYLTDPAYGPILEEGYHALSSDKQDGFFRFMAENPLPTNLQFYKGKWESEGSYQAAQALGVLDPAYLMKFIDSPLNKYHTIEGEASGTYEPLRRYMLEHYRDYEGRDFIRYLAKYHNRADEDIFLKCLDDPKLRWEAIQALAEIRGVRW